MTRPPEHLPVITGAHVRLAEKGFHKENSMDGADLILAAEMRDVLRAIVDGSVACVPRSEMENAYRVLAHSDSDSSDNRAIVASVLTLAGWLSSTTEKHTPEYAAALAKDMRA